MNNYRYAGIIYDDVANGEGLGAVLFTQGCPHHCLDCHNSETWDINGGMEFTEQHLNEIMFYFQQVPFATRLTLSGGDPLYSYDLSLLVATTFKENFPDKELWLYTGFLFKEIKNNPKYKELLELCDVVIDGKFESDKKDLTLDFRGSNNQKIIRLK